MGSRNASSCRNASSACWRRAPSPRRGTHPWSCVRGEGRWASARKPVQCASLMIPVFPVITLIVWVRNTLELVLAGAAQPVSTAASPQGQESAHLWNPSSFVRHSIPVPEGLRSCFQKLKRLHLDRRGAVFSGFSSSLGSIPIRRKIFILCLSLTGRPAPDGREKLG
jgi:hypothetical protein